jgi:hypothetical protein
MYSSLEVRLLQLQTVEEHTVPQLSDGASDETVEYGIAIITTQKKGDDPSIDNVSNIVDNSGIDLYYYSSSFFPYLPGS